jgi:hypothetical protein
MIILLEGWEIKEAGRSSERKNPASRCLQSLKTERHQSLTADFGRDQKDWIQDEPFSDPCFDFVGLGFGFGSFGCRGQRLGFGFS